MAGDWFAAHPAMESQYHEEMEGVDGQSRMTKAGRLGASRLGQGLIAAAPRPHRPRR